MRKMKILIFALCALAGLAFAQASPDAHFYFVQITDTHFGMPDSPVRATKAVNEINNLPMKIECVVVTGDITNDGMQNENETTAALQALTPLKMPVHYLPGNHDITGEPAVEVFKQRFGPLASKAEYQGVVFLMLYTEPLIGAAAVPGYDPLSWLEQELKAAGDKPVIIFHHGAAVEDFYANALHTYWPEASRARWEKLVTAPNVKGVIAGHFHRAELHWIGNTPVYVGSPLSSTFGREATYRVYEYQNGRIGYRTQYPK